MKKELWAEIVNAYRTLGLEPGASWDDIKQTHRELTKIYHPDKGIEPDDAKMKAINEARDFVQDNFAQTQIELERQRPPSGSSRPLIPGSGTTLVGTTRPGGRWSPAFPLPDEDTHEPGAGNGIRTPRRPVVPPAPSGHGLAVVGSLVLQAGWLYGAFFVANVVANGLGLRGHSGNLAAWQSWLTPLEWDWISGIYGGVCVGAILLAYILAVAANEGGMVLATVVAAPFIFGAIASAGMGIFGAIQHFGGIDLGARGLTGEGLGGTAVLAIGSAVYVGTCYVSLGLPEWVLD